MPRLTISLPEEVLDRLKASKPTYRPMSHHVADLVLEALRHRRFQDGIEAGLARRQDTLESQPDTESLTGVDTVGRLPAYRVGAGTSGNGGTESDGFLSSGNSQPEKPVSPEARVGCSSKDFPKEFVGDGVGRESEGTPRKPLENLEIVIELPDWLEPHRDHLIEWLKNRKKKHKLQPEISKLSMKALEYAKSLGVLAQYCEVASERNWQSLGFIGAREAIDKLAKENGLNLKNHNQGRPSMSPINYTLN
ncbi:MAG: hypothetical protein ACO4CS_18745 [bacterium]